LRVGFPAGPRLEWYDRNPQAARQQYSGTNVTPHAFTIRFTYTVPTGKKTFVMAAFVRTIRVQVATTLGPSTIGIYLADKFLIARAHCDNTLYSTVAAEVGHSGILLAGETCKGGTSDASTGGQMDFDIITHLVEFNA